MNRQTSIFENGLIWFGAAISLAEIITGALIAPLGFKKGFLAILVGHTIGFIIMYLAGYIGGKTRKGSMEATTISFGTKGRLLFAVLNVIQLIGWTAIMIYDGAAAAIRAVPTDLWIWCIAIGGLVILWILVGVKKLGKLNTVAMFCLMGLTIVLSFVVFSKPSVGFADSGSLSFGAAVELSVAMPLSWLPLISDYTRDAKKPKAATFASSLVYALTSCWMYVIGMGAAIFAKSSDIAQIMTASGLGAAALLIVVLSTVTTTFLDAYSAGISSEAISHKVNGKWFAVVTTLIGIFCAIFIPLSDITDFLYLIGSVFAPMAAIQIADFFILKQDLSHQKFSIKNLIIWAFGFGIYRYLMSIDLILGSTLPAMLSVIVICIVVYYIGLLINRYKQNKV